MQPLHYSSKMIDDTLKSANENQNAKFQSWVDILLSLIIGNQTRKAVTLRQAVLNPFYKTR